MVAYAAQLSLSCVPPTAHQMTSCSGLEMDCLPPSKADANDDNTYKWSSQSYMALQYGYMPPRCSIYIGLDPVARTQIKLLEH
jgi:hypothetical protein